MAKKQAAEQAAEHIFTDAQVAHLAKLAQAKAVADQAVNDFTQYLAQEYKILGDGWQLRSDRFERAAHEPNAYEPNSILEPMN